VLILNLYHSFNFHNGFKDIDTKIGDFLLRKIYRREENTHFPVNPSANKAGCIALLPLTGIHAM
jgi:hypothetical protein